MAGLSLPDGGGDGNEREKHNHGADCGNLFSSRKKSGGVRESGKTFIGGGTVDEGIGWGGGGGELLSAGNGGDFLSQGWGLSEFHAGSFGSVQHVGGVSGGKGENLSELWRKRDGDCPAGAGGRDGKSEESYFYIRGERCGLYFE